MKILINYDTKSLLSKIANNIGMSKNEMDTENGGRFLYFSTPIYSQTSNRQSKCRTEHTNVSYQYITNYTIREHIRDNIQKYKTLTRYEPSTLDEDIKH